MAMRRFIGILGVLALLAAPAFGASYNQELTWDDIKGTGGSRAVYSTVLDGTTAYNFLNLEDAAFPGDYGRITKVTDIEGTRTYTELVGTFDWLMTTGEDGINGWYGAGLVEVGGQKYLQFSETYSDAVWRVNVDTGAISSYVTNAQIQAATGESSPLVLGSATTYGTETYFYEGRTDSIYRTNAGNVELFLSDADLTAITGNDRVTGGITFDADGNMIWGSSTSDAMYSYDGTTGSTLLSTADITAVTGETSASFGDIFFAPDGNVYFYENSSDGIMSFDPSDAANTLAYVLTEAELIAGPAGSDSVGQMAWYYNSIGWTPVSTSATPGFYAVPEPTTLGLLLVGVVGLIRRRK